MWPTDQARPLTGVICVQQTTRQKRRIRPWERLWQFEIAATPAQDHTAVFYKNTVRGVLEVKIKTKRVPLTLGCRAEEQLWGFLFDNFHLFRNTSWTGLPKFLSPKTHVVKTLRHLCEQAAFCPRHLGAHGGGGARRRLHTRAHEGTWALLRPALRGGHFPEACSRGDI